MYETAEEAWHRIVNRKKDHQLERSGRKVFENLTNDQWVDILAAVCKNNIEHDGRVPNLIDPFRGIVQDDSEIFPEIRIDSVPSGGYLITTPIESGFKCIWKP